MRQLCFVHAVLLIFLTILYFSRAKNVLMIVVDDLRPALGSYLDEDAYTPNIDSFSHDSLIFQHAYAQQALCAPSRNSFLTSRRPDTLHLYDFYNYWRSSVFNFTTLPQYFKENNYCTASIGKIFHPGVSSNFSDDQPYSWTDSPYHAPTEKYKNAKVCHSQSGKKLGKNLVCPVRVSKQPGGTLPDLELLNEAKNFLHSHDKSKKFFLAVGFHKPHIPLKYPHEYLRFHPFDNVSVPALRQKPIDLPSVAWNPWTDVRDRDDIKALNVSFPYGRMKDKWVRLIRQSYFAAVSYIDDLIGHLLSSLSASGLEKDTIVLLTSDHGWSLGEHGEWSKYSNFERAVRVPFILKIPGKTDGSDPYTNSFSYVDELIELVDIFPTLVDLVGLKPLPLCPVDSRTVELCSEGISLVPLINQYTSHQRTKIPWKTGVFSQYPRPGLYPSMKPNSDKPHNNQIKIMGYSLRTEVFRYTEWLQFNPITFKANWSAVEAVELYHHGIDPEENMNLSVRPGFEKICAELRKQLRAGWTGNLPSHISL
ncbi:unnamed protein product [Bemisia tabaci]|uniref:Sulfatase N-terminal domain-containing protein n=1 Tax=Bemisia tabaci TaxID=7038 RepID=A0A9P0A2S4_BEMTA|nr:unnamed protein product [Bemisia tabaci]